MADDIKVPLLPESVNDAVVSKWHVGDGDQVAEGDIIAELETDKIVLEVPAPQSGVIVSLAKEVGDRVEADDVLCSLQALSEHASQPSGDMDHEQHVVSADVNQQHDDQSASSDIISNDQSSSSDIISDEQLASSDAISVDLDQDDAATALDQIRLHRSSASMSPSDRRKHYRQDEVGGPDDANDENVAMSGEALQPSSVSAPSTTDSEVERPVAQTEHEGANASTSHRQQRAVPMTRLRQTIAQRLMESQHTTASLTTFNELDMTKVMELRKRYQEDFSKKYGVKLGFMSFFTKACCRALQAFPEVNASIVGTDVVYHDYCDIGIAVSTEKGLVVPIIRDADQLEMDEIEFAISDYAQRAKSNKLSLDDLTGGTFSITNGGVFGSMLSTPILNPPQSAILGMHNIVKRAVVVDNAIQVRPMMFLALTYDHRLIDGSQAVQFLVLIKELLEDPDRLLLQI